jgi:uncharacterized protein (TIGR03437 family)
MRLRVLVLFLAFSVAAAAQTFVYAGDALDAASYTRSIAAGAVFVVKGSFPLPAGLKVSELPLQQTLNNVSVSLVPAAGGEPVRAWMLYTYADLVVAGVIQVAAVLPSNTATGDYRVSIASGSTTVQGGSARVVKRKFRMLTNNQEGYGLAVIQNYVNASRVDRNMFVAGTLPGGQTRAPAKAGQTVILWGLGLGPIEAADNTAPGVLDLRNAVQIAVSVGGVPAQVLYAGRSPQFPGIDQVNFVVPETAPAGCNVAVEVTVDGAASNPVTMSIAQPGADACDHPVLSRTQLDSLDKGDSLMAGEFTVTVYTEEVDYQGAVRFAEIHSAVGYFGEMTAGRASSLNFRSVAPGRCSLARGDFYTTSLLLDAKSDDSFDAGKITLSGPNLSDVPLDGDDDYYYRLFSARLEDSNVLLEGNANQKLGAGAHTIKAAGGSFVGAFESRLMIPQFLRWTNRDDLQQVRRDSGLELRWTGGASTDYVVVQGGTMIVVEEDLVWPELEVAVFTCVAPAGATSLTVPASVLKSLPVTAGYGTKSTGFVRVMGLSDAAGVRYKAPLSSGGESSGTLDYLMMITKMTPFQ